MSGEDVTGGSQSYLYQYLLCPHQTLTMYSSYIEEYITKVTDRSKVANMVIDRMSGADRQRGDAEIAVVADRRIAGKALRIRA